MTTSTKQSWRDVLPVHPAADLFPLMPEPDLKALAEDIKKNGLQTPVVVLVEDDGDDSKYQLLDGRNRLNALELAGFNLIGSPSKKGTRLHRHWFCGLDECLGTVGENNGPLTPDTGGIDFNNSADPYTYVISANIHRRHLTAEQKRDLIAKLLAADPTKSDRQVAETVKASPTTVGKVRAEAEASGDVSKVDTRTDTKGRKQQARKPAKKSKTAGTTFAGIISNENGVTTASPTTHITDENGTRLATPEDIAKAFPPTAAKTKEHPESAVFKNRDALLRYAKDAVDLAKTWHKASIENDTKLAVAARKAADVWSDIAEALEFEGDHWRGDVGKLVRRQARYAKDKRKAQDSIDEEVAEQQPAIDALVKRLVELDPDVARGVFDALALRGPCDRFEGVNFMLAKPFAMALQEALPPRACAAQTASETVEEMW